AGVAQLQPTTVARPRGGHVEHQAVGHEGAYETAAGRLSEADGAGEIASGQAGVLPDDRKREEPPEGEAQRRQTSLGAPVERQHEVVQLVGEVSHETNLEA